MFQLLRHCRFSLYILKYSRFTILVSGIQHSDSVFLQIILHLKLLQNNAFISLCCTTYPCCLFYTQQFVSLDSLPLSCPSSFIFPTGNHQFVLYICESLSVLLYSFTCLIFQIPHISVNILYLSFPVRLISLTIIPSRSIHAVANGRI